MSINKIIREVLFESKITYKKFSDLDNGWLSSEFYVNKDMGKNPYIRERYFFRLVKPTKRGTLPKNVVYMDDETANKLNKLGEDISSKINEFNNVYEKI